MSVDVTKRYEFRGAARDVMTAVKILAWLIVASIAILSTFLS